LMFFVVPTLIYEGSMSAWIKRFRSV
jgi:hypothetical protein